MGSIIREWLPSPVAEAVKHEDPERFRAIFKALEDEWLANKHLEAGQRGLETLKWVAIVNGLAKERNKAQITSEDANFAVSVLLDIIIKSEDVATRCRWPPVLSTLLHDYRWKLTLTVPWQPLYKLLDVSFMQAVSTYSGPLVMEQEKEVLVKLTRRLCRFFPPGAASEIWQHFSPDIHKLHQPDAFKALGWLALLLPTRQAAQLDGDWNQWVAEWMDAWDGVVHSSWWDSLWLTLTARLAKHDTAGAVEWGKHMPRLLTKCLWAFQVPVGTASASPPFGEQSSDAAEGLQALLLAASDQSTGRRPPDNAAHLFGGLVAKRAPRVAKLLIYLLGRVPPSPDTAEGDQALAGLERMAALLEQYYHPSNYGKTWTGTLGLFLDRLVKHFNKRLFHEQSPKGGDVDEPRELPIISGAKAVAQPRQTLHSAQLERIARVILQLASKAQYSKDNDVVTKSCHALSSMAWTAPRLILPLVQERFEMALEAVTAAHQLVTGVHTLGLCVRPLLIAGFSPAAADRAMEVDEGVGVSERVAAAEAVVAALNATLPGIDANDEPKTLAVFRFYCMLLSSVGNLPDGESALPLFTEEWVEELLARIFSILGNLEAPETRSDLSVNAGKANSDSTSFLLNANSMFRPMLELLFARLPASLRTLALKRVARFSIGSTLPSVNVETGALISAAALAAPAETAQQLLAPLLSQLEQELPALRSAARSEHFHISKVHEASLKWQLSLVTNAIAHLGSHLLPLRARLLNVLYTFMSLPSQRIAEGASSVLSGLLQALLTYYPLDMMDATPALPGTETNGVPVEAWISIDGCCDASLADLAPKWHIPSAEEVSFAEELLQQHLVEPSHALLAYCKGEAKDGSVGAEKEVVRVLLTRIQSALHGARTCLPDFAPEGPPLEGISLRLHGQVGATVGSAQMRHLAAEALLAACQHDFNDPEVLSLALTVTEEILTAGYEEHSDYGSLMAALHVDDGLLHESRTASQLTQIPGRWRVRRPRWLQITRVMIYNIWRAAESHYRPHATTLHPVAPLSTLPRIYKELSAELLRYSLHSYKGVRDRACAGLQMVSKRYSCLAPALLPTFLCALGGLPLPSTEEVLKRMGAGQAGTAAGADAGITADFVQQLLDQSLSASGSMSSLADLSAANMSKEEGRVIGACSMLLSLPIWRVVCRQLQPSVAMVAALLASSVHRSPTSSSTIAHLFMMTTLRFLRPPGLDNPQVAEESVHLPLLRDHLLHLGQPDSQAVAHWRFSLMANSLLLMLMPPHTPEQAATLTRHLFSLMQHQLSGQRTLGGMAMLYLLNPDPTWATAGVQEAIVHTTRECIAADPQWGAKLLELFSHFHPTAPSNQENNQHGRGVLQGKTRDDMLIKVVGQTFIRHLEWLSGRPAPEAIQDHSYNIVHARVVKALADAAPNEMVTAMAAPLREMLADGAQQQDDRPKTLAAIEGLTALVASGACFEPLGGGKSSAWEEWAQGLLQRSLLAAPLDFGEAWAAGLRFAVHGLAEQKHAVLQSLLQVIRHPVPQGAASSATTKRLKYIGHTLAELSYMGVLGTAPPPSENTVAQAGQAFQRELLHELPALTHSPGEVVRRHVASCAVVLLASLLHELKDTRQAEAMEVDSDAGSSQLAQDARRFLATLVTGLEEGAAMIFAEEKSSEGLGGAALLQHPAVAHAGTALQVISMATRGGEGLATTTLAPTLLQMLPSLLKIQEMTAPELQPLALEAKSSAVLLKYVPLPAAQLGPALQSLQAASRYDQWPARVAALVFAQYFWFRHNYLMDEAQAEQCQDLAVRLMRDKKLEVQELAAITLSGMLKGLPGAASAALRSQLLSQADTLFTGKRSRGKHANSGTDTETSLAEKHAVVLGLKAFVLSTPYDVPAWLPDVLMALVRAAGQPAPIKTTVRKTLGELKRTHEEAGLAEARRLLTSDQWEAIQGIASPASYFA